MSSTEKLISTRETTHGPWEVTAQVSHNLKECFRAQAQLACAHEQVYNSLSPQREEAIEMILTKIARIISGNPDEPDHWNDIAGYAYLGLAQCSEKCRHKP